MDNLELFFTHCLKIDITKCGQTKACSHIDSKLTCILCENNTLCLFVNRETEDRIFFQITEIKNDLVYIQHLPVHSSIFLGSNLELAVFDINTGKTRVEHILEKKILHLAWNSTQSILVVIDADYELHSVSYVDISMEGSFSLIKNVQVKLTLKVPEAVIVGWGSQNTQFQGPKHKKHQEVKKTEEGMFLLLI